MLLYTMLYIVLACLMLFAALTNSVCLNNASFFFLFKYFLCQGYELSGEIALKNNHYYYYYYYSHIVSNHLSQRPPNKVLQDQTPSVSPAELLLSRETRRTLAQLRTNKSPLLVSYLFSIGDPRHPSPLCPLCLMHDHTSSHLFECKSLPTSLSSLDLWTNPDKVEPFLATWGERLLAAT